MPPPPPPPIRGQRAVGVMIDDAANFTVSSAPSLPFDGREGDVLVMRNGRPTWMRPEEALRIVTSLVDGQAVTRENLNNGFHVVSRIASVKEDEPPPPPAPVIRTAPRLTSWQRLLADEE